jgi:protease IV
VFTLRYHFAISFVNQIKIMQVFMSSFTTLLKNIMSPFCRGFFFILGTLACVTLFTLAISGATNAKADVHSELTIREQSNADGKRQSLSKTAPYFVQIPIRGFIGDNKLNSQTIEKQLVEIETTLNTKYLKGILLLVDSPGGTVSDSSMIYELLQEFKQKHKIPIYAFVEGLSASGAVYISSCADKIYSTSSALIGSVGTLIETVNVSQTLEKVGVKALAITAGEHKDLLNPTRPMSENDITWAQHICDSSYNDFVNVVSQNRPLISSEDLKERLGARVFPSKEALEYGFIDVNNASRNQTLQDLSIETGVDVLQYAVIELETRQWPLSFLKSSSLFLEGSVTHRLEAPGILPDSFYNVPLFLHRPTAQ